MPFTTSTDPAGKTWFSVKMLLAHRWQLEQLHATVAWASPLVSISIAPQRQFPFVIFTAICENWKMVKCFASSEGKLRIYLFWQPRFPFSHRFFMTCVQHGPVDASSSRGK